MGYFLKINERIMQVRFAGGDGTPDAPGRVDRYVRLIK